MPMFEYRALTTVAGSQSTARIQALLSENTGQNRAAGGPHPVTLPGNLTRREREDTAPT
jgi:hypothetical protein